MLFAKGASWPVSQRDPSHQIDIAVARAMAAGSARVPRLYERPVRLTTWRRCQTDIRAWYAQEKASPLASSEMASPLARLRAINPPSVTWLAERGVDLTRRPAWRSRRPSSTFRAESRSADTAETTVPGLYAAGETAGGQHGANRPGGNALLDSQVFGRIAGESAARYARSAHCGHAERSITMRGPRRSTACSPPTGRPADEVIADVQREMSAACGVLSHSGRTPVPGAVLWQLRRDRESDMTAASLVRGWRPSTCCRRRAPWPLAALERDESRGPHLRFRVSDSLHPLPRNDERWRRYIVDPSLRRWTCGHAARPCAPIVGAGRNHRGRN